MRLIDADALKKEVDNFQNCYNGWSDTYDKAYIIEAIEEAPTIEPKTKVVAQVTFDEDKLREIVHEAVERFKEEYDIIDNPDAVSVVRCRDCKYCVSGQCWKSDGLDKLDGNVVDDDYCSRGEREGE